MAKFTSKYFTTTGTFVVPSGVTELILIGCGGGGGGGSGTSTSSANTYVDNPGGAGGGGSWLGHLYITVVPNTSYTVTIGSGGAGGVYITSGGSWNSGNAGTATTFGSLATFAPGYLGQSGANTNGSSLPMKDICGIQAAGMPFSSQNGVYQAQYWQCPENILCPGSGGFVYVPSASGGWPFGTNQPPTLSSTGMGSVQGYAGGTNGTQYQSGNYYGSGGCGGGGGPGGVGGAGGAAGATVGGNGGSAAANSGAGGGGGAGNATSTVTSSSAHGGSGGNGGSGFLYVIYVD